MVRQGHLAADWLLLLTQRVMEASCRGPLGRALAAHPLVQDADLVQRGLQVAHRLLSVYASPQRPPRSWLGMIHLDARRDMWRELSQLDWLPRELGEVVERARSAGIALQGDPGRTLDAVIDASIEACLPLPRVSDRQIRAALGAPELVSLDAPARYHPRVARDGAIGATDPALEAVEVEPGRAAAAVAELVQRDRPTVVGAFLGEPSAVKAVADAVIFTLRRPGEPVPAARRRCREQFLATGALFSAEGAECFPGRGRAELSAIDAALWSTLGTDDPGLRPRAQLHGAGETSPRAVAGMECHEPWPVRSSGQPSGPDGM